MYDTTDQASFSNVKQWLQECDRYACESVNRMILGTKCDMVTKKVVDYSTAKEFADGLGIPFFEVSSRNSTNIEESMHCMVTQIRKRLVLLPFFFVTHLLG